MSSVESRHERPDNASDRQRKWFYVINLALLRYLASVCSIELIYSTENKAQNTRLTYYQKRTWLSKLLGYIYTICMVHVLLSLYYQYRYDFRLLQLKQRLLQVQSHCPKSNVSTWSEARNSSCWPDSSGWAAGPTLDELRRAVNLERATLSAIGAPHLDANFVIEYLYCVLMILSFGFYVLPQYYFSFVTPLDFYLVRYLLNISIELDSCTAMISKEIRSFIRSSKMFVRKTLNRAYLKRYHAQASTICALYSSNSRGSYYNDEVVFHHRLTCRLLRSMQRQRMLWPINRNAEWIDNTLKLYLWLNAGSILYGMAFDSLIFAYVFGLTRNKKQKQPQYADIMMETNLVLMILINTAPALFVSMLMVCSCVDQIRLVGRLRTLVAKFRLLSETKLGPLKARVVVNSHGSIELLEPELVWQLNRELLYIIIQFKLFLVQLAPVKRIFALIPSLYTLMAILMPLVGRVHVAYVDAEEHTLFKSSVILFSMFGLIFLDVCIAPLSYLDSRCLDLFRSLQALLAHLLTSNYNNCHVWLSADGGQPKRLAAVASSTINKQRPEPIQMSSIYSEHTISSLRRELDHSHELMSQFAFVSNGITFNYPNVTRIHFWFGLIIISLLVDIESSGVFSKLIRDPLNFY